MKKPVFLAGQGGEESDAQTITLDRNNRYTNLEMYLHYLVKDIVTEQNKGSFYLGRL